MYKILATLGSHFLMTVLVFGQVGIGTNSPSEKLHISSGSYGGALLQSSQDTYLRLLTTSGGNKSWQLSVYHNTWYGLASPLIIQPIDNSGNMDISLTPEINNPTKGMVIKANGNTGIGTASPNYKLDVSGDARVTGDITASSFATPSDLRLKDVLNRFTSEDSIDLVVFKLIHEKDNREHYGYLAQNVQEIIPDAVRSDEYGMLSVDYLQVHSFKLVKQEMRIKELENQLAFLKDRLKEQQDSILKLSQLINNNGVKHKRFLMKKRIGL